MRIEYRVVSVPLVGGGPNEDANIVMHNGADRPFFAAVVDGHGGQRDAQGIGPRKSHIVERFAKTVAQGLRDRFKAAPISSRWSEKFPGIFDEVAGDIESVFRPLVESVKPPSWLSVGAVAVCAAVTREAVHIAHAGDSRAYRVAEGIGFELLTRDHNPDNKDEMARMQPFIESGKVKVMKMPSGARPGVTAPGRKRLFRIDRESGKYVGSVEPTRGFGDWEFAPAMMHTPECTSVDVRADRTDIFALCSDGGNAIVETVLRKASWRIGAVTLTELQVATLRELPRQDDDITIVYFRILAR